MNASLSLLERRKRSSSSTKVSPCFSDLVSHAYIESQEHVCHYSPLFKAAFSSSFVEGQTQEYRVEDTTPATFRLLVEWLYRQAFTVLKRQHSSAGHEVEPHDKTTHNAMLDRQDDRLVDLWILAERFIIPRLQNLVMRNLVSSMRDRSSSSWIVHAYKGTSKGSPLRRLAVDITLYHLPSDWIKEHSEHFPQEMLHELAVRVRLTPSLTATYTTTHFPEII